MADDFSADTSTTGTVAVDGSSTGILEVAGDHDWFKIQLVAGHSYIIDERGAASGGGTLPDPFVRLHNSVGTEVASDDDSGKGLDSQLSVHTNFSGTYFIDAGAFADVGTGTYTISLQDLGFSTARFPSAGYTLSYFGTQSGGWTSENQYPRLVADVNGDGMADIVGFASNGAQVSLATGGGNFANASTVLADFGTSAGGWTTNDQYPRQLADVNGDGRADIVGFASDGVYVSLATGGGNFAPRTFEGSIFGTLAGGWTSQDQYPRFAADVNGDGIADLVGFASNGVQVALGTGGGHFAAPITQLSDFGTIAGWTSDNQFPRLLADVNGDGMADIVGFFNDGVHVALATGGGHFAASTTVLSDFGTDAGGWTSQDQVPRILADVNGDGLADIVGFATNGVFVSLAIGGGHFAQRTLERADFGALAGGWNSQDQYPRLLGEVTGDRRADIIGFGSPGVDVAQSHDYTFV
jgi:VCBS repeat protein